MGAEVVPEEATNAIWMRPERAAAGRPPGHSRAEIASAAIAIADREGLDAVSMRRVAAELRTGAASLYRYVGSREELVDLMVDAVSADYTYRPPTGDWLTDLLGLGEQARTIMRNHPWLPSLVITRPVLGPNTLILLEHVLETLAGQPISTAAKLEAFAIFNATTALFVHNEFTGGAGRQQRNGAYLAYALASGRHGRLAELLGPTAQADLTAAVPDPADRYRHIMARILTGLLSPDRPTS